MEEIDEKSVSVFHQKDDIYPNQRNLSAIFITNHVAKYFSGKFIYHVAFTSLLKMMFMTGHMSKDWLIAIFSFSFVPVEMEIKSAKASDSGLWACLSQEVEGEQILDHGRLLVIPRFASGPFLFTENGNILSNSSVITAKVRLWTFRIFRQKRIYSIYDQWQL